MPKELNLQYRPISEIKPYKFNARKNEKAVKIVSTSIKEFGFLVPIIIDQDMEIVAGHTRLEASKELGIERVPTIQVTDLTEDQVKAFRIMDNKSQEYASWDRALLKREFTGLMNRMDLKLTGFRESEINRIMNLEPRDAKGDKPGKYQIVPGRVYVLGNHRLICGDSTDEMSFNKLIPPKTDIHMVYTDPPYGIDYKPKDLGNGRFNGIKNDEEDLEKLQKMITECLKQINQYLIKNGALYIFHASKTQIQFEKALNLAGFEVRQQIIWNKPLKIAFSRAHYHQVHEPFFYASRINEMPKFYGTRDNKTFFKEKTIQNMTKEEMREVLTDIERQSTVCEFKKDASKNYIHPTQKPVKMAMNYIINSSKIGENVMDCFSGSGSTLIACENTKRRCFAIELSQDFCSHIIERWEALTGKQATDENGKTVPLRQN